MSYNQPHLGNCYSMSSDFLSLASTRKYSLLMSPWGDSDINDVNIVCFWGSLESKVCTPSSLGNFSLLSNLYHVQTSQPWQCRHIPSAHLDQGWGHSYGCLRCLWPIAWIEFRRHRHSAHFHCFLEGSKKPWCKSHFQSGPMLDKTGSGRKGKDRFKKQRLPYLLWVTIAGLPKEGNVNPEIAGKPASQLRNASPLLSWFPKATGRKRNWQLGSLRTLGEKERIAGICCVIGGRVESDKNSKQRKSSVQELNLVVLYISHFHS